MKGNNLVFKKIFLPFEIFHFQIVIYLSALSKSDLYWDTTSRTFIKTASLKKIAIKFTSEEKIKTGVMLNFGHMPKLLIQKPDVKVISDL